MNWPSIDRAAASRWTSRAAMATIASSVALMFGLGIEGSRVGAQELPLSPPWPPWSFRLHEPLVIWSITLWLAELLAGVGLILALVAARHGWRPRPRWLIVSSVLAVTALAVLPPLDNGDPIYYAAYGTIADLGHSPYTQDPVRLMPAAEPIRALVPFGREDPPSHYGPVATFSEAAASWLARNSPARTIFWLKIWNALAYLALVLALDRALRSDPAQRIRAHLLWSVNPLMLFAVLANGHNDVIAAASGACALLFIRRADFPRGVLGGALLGLAIAFRTPYALFGAGLAWASRYSRRTLVAMALGSAAVLVPGYALAGKAALAATTTGLASEERPDLLWHDVAGLLRWQHSMARTNVLGLLTGVVLAGILLWRLPPGPPDRPAIRIALALGLGLLVAAPLQLPSYDAMVFPLLAVFPATRLDFIVAARNAAMTAAAAPFIKGLNPGWLTAIERVSTLGSPVAAVGIIDAGLLWLCWTRAWKPVANTRVTAPRVTYPLPVRHYFLEDEP